MMLYDLGELARLEPRSLEPVLAHKRWFTDVIAYVAELGFLHSPLIHSFAAQRAFFASFLRLGP